MLGMVGIVAIIVAVAWCCVMSYDTTWGVAFTLAVFLCLDAWFWLRTFTCWLWNNFTQKRGIVRVLEVTRWMQLPGK